MNRPTLVTAAALLVAPIALAGVKTERTKAAFVAQPRVQTEAVELHLHPGAIPATHNDIAPFSLPQQSTLVSPGSTEWPDSPYTFLGRDLELADGAPVTVDVCFGELEVLRKATQTHGVACKMKGADVSAETVTECPAYYYDVTYRLPVKVVARKDGAIVAEASMNEPAIFGFDYNLNGGHLKKEELDQAWDVSEFGVQAIRHRLDALHDVVQSFVSIAEAKESIVLRVPQSRQHDYEALHATTKAAADAVKNLARGKGGDADRQAIDDAIALFEQELATAEPNNKDARIDGKGARQLHASLAKLALLRFDFDKAEEHARRAKAMYATETFRSNAMEAEYEQLLTDIATRRGLQPYTQPTKGLKKAPDILADARKKAKKYKTIVPGSGMEACE